MLDFIFVVLVYRNTTDLKDFFRYLTVPNCKVIVVNSYYDENSDTEFKKIAESNNADFISVPNKGYGAGNNCGVEFALKHYQFKYLIISNADIEIKELSIDALNENVVNAPKIITLSGKNQNPHTPYHSKILDKWKFKAFKKHSRKLLLYPIAVNKLFRYWFIFWNSIGLAARIHAPHGAFLIVPYSIVSKLHPLFNPEMFLFAEEDHLAMKLREAHLKVCYNSKVSVMHKEDGSVGTLSSKDIFQRTSDSYNIFYQHWYHSK